MRTNRRATQRSAIKRGVDGHAVPGELRIRLGQWMKDRRIAQDLTQVELAYLVGLGGGNDISAIENGRANVTQERYTAYCDALGVAPAAFAEVILRHTDPWLYQVVYNSQEPLLLEEIRKITIDPYLP